MGGNWQLIRRLVAAGFPVVIETSVQVRGETIPWAGHNRLVIGYDGDVILTYDSYLGAGRGQGYRVPQAELDEAWRHMNRDYLVLYPTERGPEVAAILGPHWRVDQSVALAQRVALAELASNPNDVYAQYNLGATYAAMGRYSEAAAAIDEALRIGGLPVRFFWYRFGLFEAYYYTGRYNELVWFAETTLKNMGSPRGTEELYYWLGLGYAATGRQGEAIAQLAQAIAVNPRFRPAIEALLQVQDGIYHAPV
jgi:tetratricopeptide (TPR) repeat protein